MGAQVTWPELVAATSLAADTGMGLPLETGLATCLVSTRLAGVLGLDADQRRRTYLLAMLQHVGCTASSATVAEVVGDELLMREHSATLDFTDSAVMFRFMLAHVARANPVAARPLALLRAMAGGPRIMATADAICEAGVMLGTRCGYSPASAGDLVTVYENWDGSGLPGRAAGEQIPMPTRVVQVATLAVNAHQLFGPRAAIEMVRDRRGRVLAPPVVDALLAHRAEVLEPMEAADSLWDAVLAADPAPAGIPTPEEVDGALSALGDFADLKSHYLVGHSRGVAELAGRAALEYGLTQEVATTVRRAGYVHDIGRVGVSSGIWEATRRLKPDELEKIRMHPYLTQQVLGRSPFLRSLSDIAISHHERLDGSGYHRSLRGTAIGAAARVLAAADAFHTKTEPRPHRAALSAAEAADHVRWEAGAGRLDPVAVDAVATAAGAAAPRPREERLTSREIEILREVSRGGSMREIAKALAISPKTVDGHLQRIYPKIGVQTRAGATLYALEHGLVTGGGVPQGENSP
jgi:HD-GYP domain-containing protein (c-di-GMP phosphodiesterase class II)